MAVTITSGIFGNQKPIVRYTSVAVTIVVSIALIAIGQLLLSGTMAACMSLTITGTLFPVIDGIKIVHLILAKRAPLANAKEGPLIDSEQKDKNNALLNKAVNSFINTRDKEVLKNQYHLILELIKNQGIDPNFQFNNTYPLLFKLIAAPNPSMHADKSYIDLISFLLNHEKINLDITYESPDQGNIQLLQFAANVFNLEVIKLLIKRTPSQIKNINLIKMMGLFKDGRFFANRSFSNMKEIVRLLIEEGAPVTTIPDGHSYHYLQENYQREEIKKMITEAQGVWQKAWKAAAGPQVDFALSPIMPKALTDLVAEYL